MHVCAYVSVCDVNVCKTEVRSRAALAQQTPTDCGWSRCLAHKSAMTCRQWEGGGAAGCEASIGSGSSVSKQLRPGSHQVCVWW